MPVRRVLHDNDGRQRRDGVLGVFPSKARQRYVEDGASTVSRHLGAGPPPFVFRNGCYRRAFDTSSDFSKELPTGRCAGLEVRSIMLPLRHSLSQQPRFRAGAATQGARDE